MLPRLDGFLDHIDSGVLVVGNFKNGVMFGQKGGADDLRVWIPALFSLGQEEYGQLPLSALGRKFGDVLCLGSQAAAFWACGM